MPFAALGDDSGSERPGKGRKRENNGSNYIDNITGERRSCWLRKVKKRLKSKVL